MFELWYILSFGHSKSKHFYAITDSDYTIQCKRLPLIISKGIGLQISNLYVEYSCVIEVRRSSKNSLTHIFNHLLNVNFNIEFCNLPLLRRQLYPSKPVGQRHSWPKMSDLHEPPFSHGFGAQWSIGAANYIETISTRTR